MQRATISLATLLLAAALAAQPTLRQPHRLTPPSARGGAMAAIGDVDGDGRLDVVLAGFGRPHQVWRNTGEGRYEGIAASFPAVDDLCSDLLLADLDGDGDLDMVTSNRTLTCDSFGPTCTGGADRVLWNDGTGRFTAAGSPFPSDDGVTSWSVAAGDVDGDGDVDLAFGVTPHVYSDRAFQFYFAVRGENLLFLNDGRGGFTRSSGYLPNTQDNTRVLRLADFDGDGDLDIFAGNTTALLNLSNGDDVLYRNDGTGHFQAVPGAVPAGDQTLDAHPFDADGDGDIDLMLLEGRDGSVKLLINDGAGVFADQTASRLPPVTQIFEWTFADYDGDGTTDFTLGDNATSRTFLNNGAGVFAESIAGRIDQTVGTAFPLDFDGDGDADLAFGGTDYDDHEIYVRDGNGTWQRVSPPQRAGRSSHVDALLLDLDGDGDRDAVLAASGAASEVQRNDGALRFVPVAAGDFTTDVAYTEALAGGDVDGDGDDDVLCANVSVFGSGAACRLYRNDGGGTLTRIPFPAIHAYGAALGDLDGDGDLDAFLATGGTGDRVLLNQSSTFTELAGAVSPSAVTHRVKLADVDGDGDLDAICSAWNGTQNVLYRNDGSGRFALDALAIPVLLDDTRDLDVGDVDGDGDLDVVFGNGGFNPPEPNRLLLNNGSGVFTDASNRLPAGDSRSSGVVLVDVDGDGDLDLFETAFGDEYGAGSRLALNDGTGTFTAAPAGAVDTLPQSAIRTAFADLDDDGDIDAFLAPQGQPRVYANVAMQLGWRTLPAVGRPLHLQAHGAPGTPTAIALATGARRQPLPPLGILQLDPTTIAGIVFGTLDGSGQWTLTLPVPNENSLVGQSLFWQAVSGTGRLGNLEATTFRRL